MIQATPGEAFDTVDTIVFDVMYDPVGSWWYSVSLPSVNILVVQRLMRIVSQDGYISTMIHTIFFVLAFMDCTLSARLCM